MIWTSSSTYRDALIVTLLWKSCPSTSCWLLRTCRSSSRLSFRSSLTWRSLPRSRIINLKDRCSWLKPCLVIWRLKSQRYLRGSWSCTWSTLNSGSWCRKHLSCSRHGRRSIRSSVSQSTSRNQPAVYETKLNNNMACMSTTSYRRGQRWWWRSGRSTRTSKRWLRALWAKKPIQVSRLPRI